MPRQSGASVQPVFEGWQRYADGTIGMWFGLYEPETSQEIVDVPVGPANSFNTDVDSGQPTHFYTRRKRSRIQSDLDKGLG